MGGGSGVEGDGVGSRVRLGVDLEDTKAGGEEGVTVILAAEGEWI